MAEADDIPKGAPALTDGGKPCYSRYPDENFDRHGARRPATEPTSKSDVASAATFPCDRCDSQTANPENEYGENICDNCEQNAAEDAYERHCEDFHDGGCTRFNSLLDQQIEARKLK